MATESSHEALVALLIGAATVAIAASSATTSTALLLSDFDDAEFEDEDLEDDDLPYHFIPRLRPALPYNQCDFLPFFREELTEVGCQFHMRFSKAEIIQLAESLKLKDITFSNRRFAPPITALCVVLWRLATPHRLNDMAPAFGRSRSWLSDIFKDAILFLTAQ